MPVGIVLLLILSAFLAWLLVYTPDLVNSMDVARRISTGSTLERMALMLPMAVIALFVVTAVVTLYGFGTFANERQYQRMFRSIRTGTGNQPTDDP